MSMTCKIGYLETLLVETNYTCIDLDSKYEL